MKKLILVLALFAIAYSVEAQSKKNPSKVTAIEVAAPVKSIEISGIVLDVYDLSGQLDLLENFRLVDASEGNTPRDPELTLIKAPELGERAYRLAETLEEAAREDDGLNVLKRKYTALLDNKRTKYN